MNQSWMKLFLSAALLLASSFASGTDTASAEDTAGNVSKAAIASNKNAGPPIVVLKSNGVITQQNGLFIDGQTWIPVTFLRDVLNMPLQYDAASHMYSIGEGFRTVHLSVDGDWIGIDVNGFYTPHLEGKLVNGRLFVPFRLLSDYLGYQGDWYSPTKRLNVMRSKENKLNIETVTVREETDKAVIHLAYPQISNLVNPEAEKSINEVLKKTNLRFEEWIEEQLQMREDSSEHPYEFKSSYAITYNAEGVLSLVIKKYEYTGGAHGMTDQEGYTFSLRDGKMLTMDDLFGTNKDYKLKLNEELTAQLQAIPEYFGGFTGVGPGTGFYVQAGKLKVFFQLYQYTPFSYGIPKFTIPFSELLPEGK
ncbi:PdaC/SigV domain-containing protein [Paenibacillus fonticola]|uniref:PdaC/SigV domain-containing protein n=1 Tax=Paenibacillus fonticola TaxID=379896 RepID=UPI00035E6ADC|nr:DUF4163 domain-containing protein [Paenibacillus fonticola]